MVDPNAARMAQSCPDHFQKSRIAAIEQPARREADKAPILPLRAEQIRRRADREPDQHFIRPAPAMAAPGIGADREIRDQADRHSRLARGGLRRCQAFIGQRLQPSVEGDLARMIPRESLDRRAVRVPIFLRPRTPIPPCSIGPEEMPVQRLEARVRLQNVTSRAPERGEIRVIQRNPLEAAPERGEARARRSRPVHELQALEPLRFVANGLVGQFGVDDVQQGAARRRVGAEPVGISRELRVNWADRNSRRTMRSGGADESAQSAKIAHTPIAGAAHAVELQREAPQFASRREIDNREAPSRRDGKGRGCVAEFEPMIARRLDRGEAGAALIAALGIAFPRRAVLERNLVAGRIGGQRDCLSNGRSDERRQGRAAFLLAQLLMAGRDLGVAASWETNRRKHGPQRIGRHVMILAERIPPFRRDTGAPGERDQPLIAHPRGSAK